MVSRRSHYTWTSVDFSCSIWDWSNYHLLSRFSNGNPEGAHISEICFMNEDDKGLLAVGSSDGNIKIYRNYKGLGDVELLTSFRALNNMYDSNKNAGLVFEWHQGQGKFFTAGDVKVIKIWDAPTERCISVSSPALYFLSISLMKNVGTSISLKLLHHISHLR